MAKVRAQKILNYHLALSGRLCFASTFMCWMYELTKKKEKENSIISPPQALSLIVK